MPKQILLVEDSITMQKVVEITFGHEDYRITSAKDADEAMARAAEGRPDLILCDAGLPGKSGYDLCMQIKGDPQLREVPVVLLTGNFNPYDEVRGQRAGVDGHVVKPFETQVLIDKVADLLRRGKAAPQPQPAAPTLVSMPVMQVPTAAPVGAVAAQEGRRPTMPPVSSPRVTLQPPVGMPSRPPADPAVQRSTLMGIPAVNPLGSAGLRPPPPPGMRVRETGNLPAINPPAGTPLGAPPQTPSALPSWGRPATGASSSLTPAPTTQAAPAGDRPAGVGIPLQTPQMPRLPLIPRAPVPAPVVAVLERIAQRGAEYEAIAKLSTEVIEQIVWEVVPELAEAMIRAEMERLIKERQA